MRTEKTLCILAAIAALALGQIRVALAQEDAWTTGGPYGGSVWSIAIDPTDSMHLYTGQLSDFVSQTTDGGASWSRISIQGSPDVYRRGSVRTVNIHPFGPDTMFIATTKGAFKSTDAGETWSQMFHQWPNQMWNASEINCANPPVLFLGTWGSAFRSTDSGRNWTQMGWLTGSIYPIKADPVRPNIIYAGNNTSIPNASIWKSTDSGLTWQNIHHNLGRSFDPECPVYGEAIEIDPVDPEIVYFARCSYCQLETDTLLAKSTNGGEWWIDITPHNLLNGSWRILDVLVSPFDHNTVLVCTDLNGVLRSTDGGATWEEANQGIISCLPEARTLTADPRTGFIYLGWYGSGIYRSGDNGENWEKISYGIIGAGEGHIAVNFRNPDTLFTSTTNGFYMSADGAASWRYVELRSGPREWGGYRVTVDPYDPSYIYVVWNNGGEIYRSTDGGANWELLTPGPPPGRWYREIAVADYYGSGWRRLFMGSSSGLFFSDDLGHSWSQCAGGLPTNINAKCSTVSPVDPDLVFVYDGWYNNSTPYKSTDGGSSWTLLMNCPRGVKSFVCDPVNPDIVYVVEKTDDHVYEIYKSTDGGLSWVVISEDIPRNPRGGIPQTLSGLAVNPLNPDNIFVLSHNCGIFQSHDGGNSWENFNLNMEGTDISTGLSRTVIVPSDTSRIFLGLYGSSVWTITRDTTTAIDDQENILPLAFASSSYPNPFNAQTTIEYSLPQAGHVDIEIFDLLGRKVQTLVSEDQEAGQHQVVWDAKDRASGLYFYRIDAGEHSDMKKMILLK